MALNPRVDPWIGDQRRRLVQAREEAIIDKPISHGPLGETAEQKAERQKRREAIGQRYLAGRGAPFILSAQLRGPFDKASGWKNPWLPEEPEIEPVPKENIRPLPLQKAFRDNASLTGRQRKDSVASTRSHISIASGSQSMAGDRLNAVRQLPARPNLHGGLKHFLGTAGGATPSSTRKLDRDNLPQLPAQKRKADTSWLRGADIVKKKRRELPDLPSPTPPSRVSQDRRQFVTPTNLLDKFRQHSQSQSCQETPTNKRPAITSSQSSFAQHLDIPTPSQRYSPPFKRQRRSLLAAPSPDPLAPNDIGDKKVLAKSRLSQANRRSTSNASALTDVAMDEGPVRPPAARVRSLNESREVVGSSTFKFRRTKLSFPKDMPDNVVSSIEVDDEDGDAGATIGDAKVDIRSATAQMAKQPTMEPVVVIDTIISAVVAEIRDEHIEQVEDEADGEIADTRVRNSRSLPSDSETESPEKARLSANEQQKRRHTQDFDQGARLIEPTGHTLSSQSIASNISLVGFTSAWASQSKMVQRQLTTIQEVTETTHSHADATSPSINTCTTATESLVMNVVRDEMLHEDEGDTTMPDIPESPDELYGIQDRAVVEEMLDEVAETTYVQMASGSISTGSVPNVSHSTAMNTQAIEAMKARLLEEREAETEEDDIVPPVPEIATYPGNVVQKVTAHDKSPAQSQFLQKSQASTLPEDTPGADFITKEDEESSEPTLYAQRQQAGRPQISSSEPTNAGTATTDSQTAGQPSVVIIPTQQSSGADPTVDDILRILRSSQRRESNTHDRTPTQRSQDRSQREERAGIIVEHRGSNNSVVSWHEEEPVVSSPARSQVYSHIAMSPFKSLQSDAPVQSQTQTQPQSQPHDTVLSQTRSPGVLEEGSSGPTNTGTTTTESLLLHAIAQDMAREDEGGISVTGMTETTDEKDSGQSENTPKPSLSQWTVASKSERVLVEESSNEFLQEGDASMAAAEVLQKPETQYWHLSVIEDSTMTDVDSDGIVAPQTAIVALIADSKATSSPLPSLIPASVEEARPKGAAPISLSDNPWANGTQAPCMSTPARPASIKRVAFSDHHSSSSVDDDDLDLPQQSTTVHLPSSPPPRIIQLAPIPAPPSSPTIPRAAPIFSPPPVYHEPPSTESPLPIIINGLRHRPQPSLPQSSQGMGMANAFIAADRLAPIREDTLSPPPRMAPPRQLTPVPRSGAVKMTEKGGQSSVARALAEMYPSSSEDEADIDSPGRPQRVQSQSERQGWESLTFLSQEHYTTRNSSPPVKRNVARVQVSRSPSTITDPHFNPWLTQAPPAPVQEAAQEYGEGDEEYEELPPFSLGGIMGMLGDGFGSGATPGGEREMRDVEIVDEGVGRVADEMSDLLEEWDVEVEMRKVGRESRGGKGEAQGKRRSSARERVGWGRF